MTTPTKRRPYCPMHGPLEDGEDYCPWCASFQEAQRAPDFDDRGGPPPATT